MKRLIEIENPFTSLEGYNCIGCSPNHQHGLRLKFFYDKEDDAVLSFLDGINDDFSGFPGIVHGGIQGLLLDEIMFWIIYQKYKIVTVTASINIKFKKTVKTNEKLTIKAKLKEEIRGKIFKTEGFILKGDEILVYSEGVYIKA